MPKEVIMPALGMAQETGTLLRWLKKAGDTVQKGEPLMEIATDKVDVEIESPASGTLAQITAAEGDEIPVGQTIALILAPGEAAPEGTTEGTEKEPKKEPKRPQRAESRRALCALCAKLRVLCG